MGKGIRPKPERLAEKLRLIRAAFELSQTEMLSRLGVDDLITYHRISDYERGVNEPPLMILLQYARLANVSTDALIDDELDLPERLPSRKKHEGVRRQRRKQSK
ncbi:MAG TPA: helix-turn-helix transcriptional regulator [Pyrinomonadaceae bacterium]|jgi:transcriptional regulator with XRE-family HTH domain